MENTKEQFYRDIIESSGIPGLVNVANQVDKVFENEQQHNALSKKEILNIKDDDERQKAIGKNLHLFRK